MGFTVHQVPVWRDNYAYVLAGDDGTAAIVDSPEAGPVLELIEALGLKLTHLFNTHHHPDHIGSNLDLLKYNPKLQVFGSKFDQHKGRIDGQNRGISDGDQFTWSGVNCTIKDVKAHTLGHIAYIFENNCAFVGDTLFSAGCGRLFEGTAKQLDKALYEVLGSLPDPTLVYCAHEYTEANLRFAYSVDPNNQDLLRFQEEVGAKRERGESTIPTTMGLERKVNPFLRCDSPAIRHATGHELGDPRHEVLGKLRTMKDCF